MAASIILNPGERLDWREEKRLRCDRPHRAFYGTHQSGARCYWITGTLYRSAPTEWFMEGFAPDRQSAVDAAQTAAREQAPTGYVIVYSAQHAKERFRERHAKVSRFRADWRGRFPFWAARVCLWECVVGEGDDYWHRVPIVSVTNKWVFIPRDPQFRDAVAPPRIARRDCRALPREKLERDGKVLGRGWWESFHVEEPPPAPKRDTTAANRNRIAELRAVMQREHPDRGGDVEKFRAAQREYATLRRAAR